MDAELIHDRTEMVNRSAEIADRAPHRDIVDQ